MYGIIGKVIAVPGQRDPLINVLLAGASQMTGCISYIVARDVLDENALWVTEVWDSQASHIASLSLPEVQQAIQSGRHLIAAFTDRIETEPVSGFGLQPPGTDIAVLLKRLSAPAQRVLRNSGMATLEEVSQKTAAELLGLHGIGKKGLIIIKSTLQEYSLSLATRR